MSVIDGFAARSRRERILILVAAGLFLLVVLGLATGQARAWREAAEQDARRARAELVLAQRVLTAPAAEGDALTLVEAAALEHGVSIETARGEDGLEIAVASVASAALFAFLSDLDARGLAPASFTIVENADATLQMQGRVMK